MSFCISSLKSISNIHGQIPLHLLIIQCLSFLTIRALPMREALISWKHINRYLKAKATQPGHHLPFLALKESSKQAEPIDWPLCQTEVIKFLVVTSKRHLSYIKEHFWNIIITLVKCQSWIRFPFFNLITKINLFLKM